MPDPHHLLAVCMFFAAMLYASVGHAGASAYLALMALFGVAPAVMRPTALFLNILVAGFITHRYLRAGLFRWRKLWPFLIGSVPFAFIGGAIQLPGVYYRWIVGIALLIGGARLLWPKIVNLNRELHDPPVWAGVLLGIAIGLLSGLTGTGGGIFLSPVILFFGWADIRTTSGIAASFILCNSIAGLLGNVTVVRALPSELPLYAAAVMLGAAAGGVIGTRIDVAWIQRALGLVLIIAGTKLIGVH
jgi:uncharacterized membrane protein YfcA